MKTNNIEYFLNKIQQKLEQLFSLLNNENHLLSASDFENINAIAEQKKLLITAIEIDDLKFKTLLKSQCYFDFEQKIHDIIKMNLPECNAIWINIEQLLQACKDKNNVNGIILSNNRRQIKESIAILYGQTSDIVLYGATGESVHTQLNINLPISV